MFKVEIETGNAAFKDPFTGEDYDLMEATEIRSLLARISSALERGEKAGVIMDYNGNKVGSWSR